MTDLARDETPAVVSDEQLGEWEALVEKLNVDEYNQAVPKNAPWRAQPGPCRNWTVYQPIAPSGDYRIVADELREPFATFIAAARTAVPLLVRALRDARAETAYRLEQFNRAKDQRDRAEAEADDLRHMLAETAAKLAASLNSSEAWFGAWDCGCADTERSPIGIPEFCPEHGARLVSDDNGRTKVQLNHAGVSGYGFQNPTALAAPTGQETEHGN